MKVLILGRIGEDTQNKNAETMYKALKKRKIKVDCRRKSDVTISMLAKYDKIICFDNSYNAEINDYLNQRSGVYNKPCQTIYTVDKWLNYLYIKEKDTEGVIKQPKTYSDWIHDLQFPIVIKDRYGSLGYGMGVVSNMYEFKEARDLLIKDKLRIFDNQLPIDEILIYQEIIQSSWGRDLRVILIGGKYVACEMRKNDNGQIQSNLAQGGTAYTFEITEDIIHLCEKIASILKLDYVGIDLLFGENGDMIFCEANSSAFFEGITKVTGIDICEKYIDYILNNKPVL